MILLMQWSGLAKAWDGDARGDMQLALYGRVINASSGYTTDAEALDGFYQIETLLRERENHFQLEIQPEMLGLVGSSSALPNTDASHLSVAPPVRFLHLSTSLVSNQTGTAYFDFDRLDLSYASDHVTAYVGRKPVGLGVLKIFPVWNKFSRPPPVVSGPPLIFGEDSANVRAQFGQLAFQALQVQGPTQIQTASIGEGIWYAPFGEIHVLESYWWQEQVAGFAGAFDVGGATLRVESLFIGLSPSDHDRQTQIGVGAEYAFSEKWSAIAEAIYQSAGVFDPANYSLQLPSRYLSLQAAGYVFGRADYKVGRFWTLAFGGLLNCIDGSSILVPRLEYSITENLDLITEFDIPLGPQGTELSTQAYNFPGGNYIGAPYQGSVTLKASF